MGVENGELLKAIEFSFQDDKSYGMVVMVVQQCKCTYTNELYT